MEKVCKLSRKSEEDHSDLKRGYSTHILGDKPVQFHQRGPQTRFMRVDPT